MPFDMEKEFGEFKADFDKVTAKLSESAKAAMDEAKRLGGLTDETKAAADKALAEQGALKNRLDEMGAQFRDLEQRQASGRRGGAAGAKSLGQQVIESDRIKDAVSNGVHGDVRLGVFNAITGLPGSGGALLPEQRDSEIVADPTRKLRIKDLITTGETTAALIKYFREVSRTGAAGFVPDDGVTVKPLIDKTFKPDAAAGQLTDGLTPGSVHAPYLGHFPYLGVPYSGYNEPS